MALTATILGKAPVGFIILISTQMLSFLISLGPVYRDLRWDNHHLTG